jgi:hypothetical protein
VLLAVFQLANDGGKFEGNAPKVPNSPNKGVSMPIAKSSALTENVIPPSENPELQLEQHDEEDPEIPNDLRNPSSKKNLMFIKTHKCGTSTLVDVFYLRGVRQRLNFVMHPYRHKLNVGHA